MRVHVNGEKTKPVGMKGFRRNHERAVLAGPKQVRPCRKNRFAPSTAKEPCGARALERKSEEAFMDGLIYLIGLVVVVMAILSFFGLH